MIKGGIWVNYARVCLSPASVYYLLFIYSIPNDVLCFVFWSPRDESHNVRFT